MALPKNNTAWPPYPNALNRAYQEHHAWWTGDTAKLAEVYAHAPTTNTAGGAFGRYGLFGGLRRFFWGKQDNPTATSRPKLHIPLASDIAETSANLLYANPPTITAADLTETSTFDEAIAEYVTAGLHGALLEGAEIGAAYGGRYHIVTRVPGINNDKPFLDTISPDRAAPEFAWGHLVAVTFATPIDTDHTTVYWQVERHELDEQGRGVAYHGLYRGTATNLGMAIPLTEHPATEQLANLVNSDGSIGNPNARTPGLNAVYVPNNLPNRKFRDTAGTAGLGRSDYDGVEQLFDALDETWTSWMRDLRLARARILISKDMLETRGSGSGAWFDLDREIFTPLEGVLPNPTAGNAMPIESVQFPIRVEEHSKTVEALVQEIIRSCGYSEDTFGDYTRDTDITATEVRARSRRTLTTRAKKIRYETIALRALIPKMLSLDPTYNGPSPSNIGIEFEETIHESAEERARTATLLRGAEAASTFTRVAYVHPDWGPDEVAAEVARIQSETGTTMVDPDVWRPTATLETGTRDDA
ncbi:phage portal protein, putative, A118 family [Actinobaculum suis]|uniref:Phage portal protein, putative, A118 family n=1 Tax=Actinobaculum suis TaxID=1657 RepID=A0A7Z8Y8F4_9ACTO|nr:phage portal protein [Actinobaculum suis]VDG76173.1 phage portal protein, putative, A118 family [Actinobaculum suis]